jgi:hypothetical protein
VLCAVFMTMFDENCEVKTIEGEKCLCLKFSTFEDEKEPMKNSDVGPSRFVMNSYWNTAGLLTTMEHAISA